jgi:hypothetical protein
VPTRRKLLRKSRNIYTWIRQRTSPFDFGIKSRAGKPAHCNKNDDIKYHFQCLKSGWWGRRLSTLTNADMADHFTGRKTYYFTADGRSSNPEVLINLDIDCHRSGNLAGAVAFAEHLKATRFPNLYYEASTNGNGVHGYIVIVKGDLGDKGLNGALGLLDKWLKHELSSGDWDVENVEVKGQCPVFGWGRNKFELKTYTSGQLAKLPREALERADELRGTTCLQAAELRRTTCLQAAELRRLKVPAVASESGDSIGRKRAKSRERQVVGEKAKRIQSGSIVGRHFGEDELAKLDGSYLSLSKELLGEKKLDAAGRKVVTEADLAIFLMLLRFFTTNRNADGSLPTARWRAMWSALYEAGDIERGWCQHRYKAMRDFLSREGLLDWEDEDYVVGVLTGDGRFVPGKAAKWRAGEELMERMEEEQPGQSAAERCGDMIFDVEEKSILYGCSELDREHEEKQAEGGSILYGCKTTPSPSVHPTPRQPEPLRAVLDRLGIDVPLSRPRFAGFSWGQFRMAA